MVLGAYVSGLPVENGAYPGGPLDWIAPFPLFTGVALVFAYALLGSTWLIMKTEGALQARMVRVTRPLSWVLLAAIAVISLWTPLRDPVIAERWFSFPNIVWFSPVPLLVVGAALLMQRALARGRPVAPFLLALLLMFLGYAGLAISGWPRMSSPALPLPRMSSGAALLSPRLSDRAVIQSMLPPLAVHLAS